MHGPKHNQRRLSLSSGEPRPLTGHNGHNLEVTFKIWIALLLVNDKAVPNLKLLPHARLTGLIKVRIAVRMRVYVVNMSSNVLVTAEFPTVAITNNIEEGQMETCSG
jgi:hypothetical protein